TRAVAGKKRPTDRASLRPDEDVACVIFYLSFSAVLSSSPATALDGNIQALPTRRASRSGIDTESEQIPLPPFRTTVREVIYFYGSGPTGSRTRASQPSPSISDRLPPCASAIWRLRTSPIPEPPGLVVKKGTKRLAVSGRPN